MENVQMVTIPLSWLIAAGSGFVVLVSAIAATVIWMYSTFITRVEAGKIETAVQQMIELFKEVFDEKFKAIHERLDEIKPRRLKVVKGKERTN